MRPHWRLVVSASAFYIALMLSAGGSSMRADTAFEGYSCDETTPGSGGAGHKFGGEGLCYQCAPYDCHALTLPGYCSGAHYRCEVD